MTKDRFGFLRNICDFFFVIKLSILVDYWKIKESIIEI